MAVAAALAGFLWSLQPLVALAQDAPPAPAGVPEVSSDAIDAGEAGYPLRVPLGGDAFRIIDCPGCAPHFEAGTVLAVDDLPDERTAAPVRAYAAVNWPGGNTSAAAGPPLLVLKSNGAVDLAAHRFRGWYEPVVYRYEGFYDGRAGGTHHFAIELFDLGGGARCSAAFSIGGVTLVQRDFDAVTIDGARVEIPVSLARGVYRLTLDAVCDAVSRGQAEYSVGTGDERRPLTLVEAEDAGLGVPAPEAASGDADDGGPFNLILDHETIRGIQITLNNLGFRSGPVDGWFGPRTSDALRLFKQMTGVAQTPLASRELFEALERARRNELYLPFGTEKQLVGRPFTNLIRGMLSRDRDALRRAGRAFERAASQSDELGPVTWSAPSGFRGRVEIVSRTGECVLARHMITKGQIEETANFYACQDDAGTWKLSSADTTR